MPQVYYEVFTHGTFLYLEEERHIIPIMEPSREQLIAIGLKFSTGAQPLKVRALADVSAKALYSFKRPATVEQVAQKITELVGIRKVSTNLVEEALNSLEIDRDAVNIPPWSLTKEAASRISDELKASDHALEGVLERHFPKKIPSEVLKNWFLGAATNFIAFNATEWVNSILKRTQPVFSKIQTIDELLAPASRENKLEEQHRVLVASFEGFLNSEDGRDQAYLMDLAFALFSSKLIAADVGADPVTTHELEDSLFILDTNVLLAIQLGKFPKAISALGTVFARLNCQLGYFHITEEEYRRVVTAAQTNVIEAVDAYPAEIIAGAWDDFTEAGTRRGYQTAADYENFFREVRLPPTSFGSGPAINKIDYPELQTQLRSAEVDASLKASLKIANEQYKQRVKGEPSTEHDSGLIRLVEWLRSSRKVFILTLDRSFQSVAAERSGAHNLPSAILLDGLIQILALDNAGPLRSATDFAPLLGNLMTKRCMPSPKTYTTRDLNVLYSMHESVTRFSPDRIKRVLQVVTNNRLAGRNSEDNSFKLEVDRAFRQEERQYEDELQNRDARTRVAEEALAVKDQKLKEVVAAASEMKRAELVRRARFVLAGSLSWRIPTAALLSIVLGFFMWKSFEQVTDYATLIGLISGAASLFGSILLLVKKPLRAYSDKKILINEQIEELVQHTIA